MHLLYIISVPDIIYISLTSEIITYADMQRFQTLEGNVAANDVPSSLIKTYWHHQFQYSNPCLWKRFAVATGIIFDVRSAPSAFASRCDLLQCRHGSLQRKNAMASCCGTLSGWDLKGTCDWEYLVGILASNYWQYFLPSSNLRVWKFNMFSEYFSDIFLSIKDG